MRERAVKTLVEEARGRERRYKEALGLILETVRASAVVHDHSAFPLLERAAREALGTTDEALREIIRESEALGLYEEESVNYPLQESIENLPETTLDEVMLEVVESHQRDVGDLWKRIVTARKRVIDAHGGYWGMPDADLGKCLAYEQVLDWMEEG